MTAQQILKLIEEVSPDDTAKLDEIDARVWCYIKGYEFSHMGGRDLRGNPDLCYFKADNPKFDSSNYQIDQDGNGYSPPHSWDIEGLWWAQTTKFKMPYGSFLGYSRSRDALKAIRPEGFKTWAFFDGYKEGAKYRAEMFTSEMLDEQNRTMREIIIQTDWLPTEELAELHAIIQAIEYERNNA